MRENCIVQVAQYYKQFKKSGDPKKAKIQREDFLGIMQVREAIPRINLAVFWTLPKSCLVNEIHCI